MLASVIPVAAAAVLVMVPLIASMDQDYYQLLRDPGPDHGAVRVLNTAMRPGSRRRRHQHRARTCHYRRQAARER